MDKVQIEAKIAELVGELESVTHKDVVTDNNSLDDYSRLENQIEIWQSLSDWLWEGQYLVSNDQVHTSVNEGYLLAIDDGTPFDASKQYTFLTAQVHGYNEFGVKVQRLYNTTMSVNDIITDMGEGGWIDAKAVSSFAGCDVEKSLRDCNDLHELISLFDSLISYYGIENFGG